MNVLYDLSIATWQPQLDESQREALIHALEDGKVLHLPSLEFLLNPSEKKFLSPDWLTGARKNISLDIDHISGAQGGIEELEQLRAMMERFSTLANQLMLSLLPRYSPYLKSARASFRPAAVMKRENSWRKDDSRLHVDAFPSRPNRGERILRVFTNINPYGEPRVWRVGEPFIDAAQHFLPHIGRPFPGSAAMLDWLGITKSRRSEYDHIMLHLHDAMKADTGYQRESPQREVAFAPGSTWICFSDQVLHAAMSGQYLLEQTLHIPISAQAHPELSPLRALERLRGRALT
jgi:hypothetical protein